MRLAVPALCAALLCLPGALRAERLDGVAAVVGSHVILISEVESTAEPVIARIQSQQGPLPGGAVRQIMEDALQALIDERLVLDWAGARDIGASAEEIDQVVAGHAADRNVSVERIYEAVEDQGLDRDAYRQRLRNDLIRMKVVRAVASQRIAVLDSEVRELYEERFGNAEPGMRIRLRQIVLPWPEKPTEQQRGELRAQAEQIRRAALDGEDFAALAGRYSRAPSGARGGLTVLRESEVAPAFAGFLFESEPGMVSPVIETPQALNLLMLLERFDPSAVAFDDVADELRDELAERKAMPEFQKWVEELRTQTYVEVVAPDLR